MPICPQCSATIHPHAEDECPSCGYSLLRANELFGDAMVEFTRVVDAAGALTHPERMDLLRTLENLERRISPAALCIYITDDGRAQHLRSHAHWILNHARIHHPSFGKRDQQKARENAVIRERRPGEELPRQEAEEGFFTRLKENITNRLRDALYPVSPPVRQDWMLVLVIDVQLEMACFSWGYMLDPYVNPDRINSTIVSAKLQFRERAFVPGLKKVMGAAVSCIASEAHRVNRRLARAAQPSAPRTNLLLVSLLGLGLLAAPADAAPAKQQGKAATTARSTSKSAAKPAAKTTAKSSAKPAAKPAAKPVAKPTAAKETPKPAVKPTPQPAAQPQAADDDEVAEEVTEEEVVSEETVSETPAAEPSEKTPAEPAATPAETPPPAADTPTAPAPVAPAAASYDNAPRWQAEHYRKLMAGELETGYASLFPAASAAATAKPAALPSVNANERSDESDTRILGRYCEAYSKNTADYLRDPQGLLTSPEREDVLHVLRMLNAQARYRIYVAVVKAGQEIPAELSVETLAGTSLPVGEYAVLMLYPLGNPSGIELGYQLIQLEETPRHEGLTKVREAAAAAGGGEESLLAAVQQVSENINPLAAAFTPVTAETAAKAPLVEIKMRENTKPQKVSVKEKLKKALENPENLPILWALLGVLVALTPVVLYFCVLRRGSARLLETPPDLRLSSPYGAGVSRYVRYLEGQVAGKEKRLF